MEIIRFARNNIYRIGTNGTACAVSVPVGDTEMLELCRAIVKLEGEGHTITSVMKLCSNGFDDSVNFRNLKERVCIGVKGKSTGDCGRRI